MSYTKEELAHWGVKGMKWGVRRTNPSTGKRELSTGAKVAVGVGSGALIAAGLVFASRTDMGRQFSEILGTAAAAHRDGGSSWRTLKDNLLHQDRWGDYDPTV